MSDVRGTGFDDSVRNGGHRMAIETSVANCCSSTRRFPTTHPFKGNSTNHNAFLAAPKSNRDKFHNSSTFRRPPPLLALGDIAEPSTPRVHGSTGEQLDRWPHMHYDDSLKNNMRPQSQWHLAAVIPRSSKDDKSYPTNRVTVIDLLDSSAEPINLCIDQRWPNDYEAKRALNGKDPAVAPPLTTHSGWSKVDSSSMLSNASNQLTTSTGGGSILRRVLMEAKTRYSSDHKEGVTGVTQYVREVTNSRQRPEMNLCSPATPAGWTASTTNTAIRHGTMVQHQPSRLFDAISLPVDCCLGFQRPPSSTVQNFDYQSSPRRNITDTQWSASVDQQHHQPSMDDYTRVNSVRTSMIGRPNVNRIDAPVSSRTGTFGQTVHSAVTPLDSTSMSSSDGKIHEFPVSQGQLPPHDGRTTAVSSSMTSSQSAFHQRAYQSTQSAIDWAGTSENSRYAFVQNLMTTRQSMKGSVRGVVVSASDRHTTSVQVQQWLDEISTFATAYRKFAGLSNADHMTLLRRSRSRLLLLYMAEFNFRFSVDIVATVQTEFTRDEHDLLASSSSPSTATVTTETVRQLRVFIKRCHALRINCEEYHCMRLIVLFHTAECDLERPDLVRRINSNASVLLRKMSQSSPNSPMDTRRRYADLLLRLRALYSLRCNAIETLFLGAHSVDATEQ